MKSVGEVMAIGRTFQESLQKALRGLETGVDGLTPVCLTIDSDEERTALRLELRMAGERRLWYVADAFRLGLPFAEIAELTGIDPWFLSQIEDLVAEETALDGTAVATLDAATLRRLKQKGFSDSRIATLLDSEESVIRHIRYEQNLRPVFK